MATGLCEGKTKLIEYGQIFIPWAYLKHSTVQQKIIDR
jgi:hypothetical protein